jgi:hypothetical protein
LVEFLKPEPPAARPVVRRSAQPGNPYAIKAFENELAMLVQSPTRTRNNTLNRAAYNLFRFVAAGELPYGVISDALLDAARHTGLPAFEAKQTITSAARARGLA